MNQHSAAILAGGRATRFDGRDKGALVVDGRTILDRQLAELSVVTDDILVVGGRFPYRVEHGSTRFIPDIIAGCGPLGGVQAALSEARGEAVFVVACDMPYVTAPLVAYLLELAQHADVVVPRTERGYHPLCAVYTRACADAIGRRLAERQLRMTGLFADVRTRIVTGEEIDRFGDRDRLLANVNTPAEYAGLEALQGHKL
jgi:molybdopterin-guanine dinucleotide biosynthesis protein A